jgi:ArsR family transcriptional regulator
MEIMDIPEPCASRHLSVLYDAGFLKRRREGLWAWYSIDTESLKEICADLIEAVRKALEGNETALQDRQRLRNTTRVGPSCALTSSN